MVPLFHAVEFVARGALTDPELRSALHFLVPGAIPVAEAGGAPSSVTVRFEEPPEIEAFWWAGALSGLIDPLLGNADRLVDAGGVLRFALERERALRGEMVLAEGEDAIQVAAEPRSGLAGRADGLAAARENLQRLRDEVGATGATHVVTAFLHNRGEVLLLRRSSRVRTYRGRWAGISGYLEEGDSPADRARTEIREEVGLDDATLLQAGRLFLVEDGDEAWVVHPFAFETDTRELSLDWETEEARWVPPSAMADFETVPGLPEAYAHVARD